MPRYIHIVGISYHEKSYRYPMIWQFRSSILPCDFRSMQPALEIFARTAAMKGGDDGVAMLRSRGDECFGITWRFPQNRHSWRFLFRSFTDGASRGTFGLLLRGCRKTCICCVTLILRHCGVLLCTPRSLGFRSAEDGGMNVFHQPLKRWFSDSLLSLRASLCPGFIGAESLE